MFDLLAEASERYFNVWRLEVWHLRHSFIRCVFLSILSSFLYLSNCHSIWGLVIIAIDISKFVSFPIGLRWRICDRSRYIREHYLDACSWKFHLEFQKSLSSALLIHKWQEQVGSRKQRLPGGEQIL